MELDSAIRLLTFCFSAALIQMAEIQEDDLQPEENFFVRTFHHAEAIFYTFTSIVFSVSAMKIHLMIYFLWIMVQLVSSSEKEPPLAQLLVVLGEGIAILFATMAITSYTSLLLIPLMVMASLECARFAFHAMIIIFYMKGLVLFEKDLFFLPEMVENGLQHAVLCLCLMFFSYFSIIVSTAVYLYCWCDDVARRQAENAERERQELARFARPFILQMPAGGQQQLDVVEENSDSPPNYSLVCRQPPEAVHTAKSETSPPRYSRLEQGSQKEEE